MGDNESQTLRGNTLKIYRYLLKIGKPVGIREIQRTFKLSSPSLVQYHLIKLEHLGLIKKERSNYIIKKVVLENYVRVSRFLLPRYLFYTIFATFILLVQFMLPKPFLPTPEPLLSIIATTIFVLIFSYETIRAWLKHSL